MSAVKKIAAIATLSAAAMGVSVGQADAAQKYVRYGYGSWSSCDKERIAYFHDGAQTGGCKKTYVNGNYVGYGFVYWYR